MGQEAYRLAVRFETSDKSKIYKKLIEYNAKVVEECKNGDIEFEITTCNGFIELYLTCVKHETPSTEGVKEIHIGKAVLRIRFAKSNSNDLVDDIVNFVSKLSEDLNIEYFGDAETKKSIEFEDYNSLKVSVINAKKDFESYFSKLPYPIRCKDVFPTFRELNPDRVSKKSLT